MEQQIVVLSDKQKARDRINVFHGSSNNWINMIKELIGNSFDVFSKDKLNHIKIIIHNKNKIEFIDDACGIPVEGVASDGSPEYQAIFEKDFAGSRYGNVQQTIGQNGIFLYTLSMSSQDVEYYISRPNGNLYHIAYHKGDRVDDLKIIGKEENTYSRIIFSLDEEVWSEPNFTFNEINEIVKSQASLCNVEITLEDKINDIIETHYYKNGIETYFEEMVKDKSIVTENIRIVKSTEVEEKRNINYDTRMFNRNENEKPIYITITDKIDIDFIFNYSNDSEQDFQKEFLNTADLLQHGTIQDGIVDGLKNCIHKWLDDNKKYNKNEKAITIDDISTGLNYICNFKSFYVEYDNQVKQRTSVKRYKKVMAEIIKEFMEIYFIENPIMAEKLCNQVLINSRARIKSNQARLDEKKKQSDKKIAVKKLIGKLKDATYENREECELHLTEGDSSGGNAKQIVDKTQGVLPQKGKSENIYKNSNGSNFSDEIQNIIDSLGIYTGSKYNQNDLRYGRVILDADADSDGYGHITCLWLSFFYKHLRKFIEEGRLFISIPPLYKNTKKDKSYVYTYSEKDQLELLKNENFVEICRYKGLGEMDACQLQETIFNKKNRNLIQVTIDSIEEADDVMELLMGKNVAPRCEFIIENAGYRGGK